MTLTLDLTPEEEERLRVLAARQGVAAEEYVLRAVKPLLSPEDRKEKVAALRSLLEDDEEEQRETGEYLLRALDEDRLSDRKLYS
jgi:plasmid stability protein